MMPGIFSTVRAFFLGFARLSRSSAQESFQARRTHLLATLMFCVYLSVMSFYFFHHGKVIPKEQTSDKMVLVFEYALAPVFYMGFHQLALFLFREDVQREFSRYVTIARRGLLYVWSTLYGASRMAFRVLRATVRTTTRVAAQATARTFKVSTYLTSVVCRFVLRHTGRMAVRAARLCGAVVLIAIASGLEGYRHVRVATKNRVLGMKRFAADCVEVGSGPRL